ncbi:hypothetical protein [Blastomonas sp.]|uniref:hypothetical protein n=1 Tax=Blastomonas TaxID=150203 RepID=UPI00258AE968|nr:hypothetical protein [Blastomonas sp.]
MNEMAAIKAYVPYQVSIQKMTAMRFGHQFIHCINRKLLNDQICSNHITVRRVESRAKNLDAMGQNKA